MQVDQTAFDGGIYIIRCIPNGKIYIGSAVNLIRRWKRHCRVLKLGKHHSKYLQEDWNEYGPDAFTFEILEVVVDPEELISAEQEYLTCFGSWRRDVGYNISPTAGSVLGYKMPLETREKIAEANRGKKKGPHSSETRAQMSEVKRGKPLSAEHKARISAGTRGKKMPSPSSETRAKISAANRGKKKKKKKGPLSPEHREKLSSALKGRTFSPEHKAKISAATTEQWRNPEHRERIATANRGKILSPEHKAKISAAVTEQWRRQREKDVLLSELEGVVDWDNWCP